jgi:hypothetical protein
MVIDLSEECFSYTVCDLPKVGSAKGLHIPVLTRKIIHVVYKDVLSGISIIGTYNTYIFKNN